MEWNEVIKVAYIDSSSSPFLAHGTSAHSYSFWI